MINKIETNPPLIESGPSSRQSNSAGALPDKDADVSVQVNYGSLIDKATQGLPTDTQVVQRAREFILSGESESLKIIRKTAKDIIRFGI